MGVKKKNNIFIGSSLFKQCLISLVLLLTRHGNKDNALKIVNNIIARLLLQGIALDIFFVNLLKALEITIVLRKWKVAGKVTLVPVPLFQEKRINYSLRLILRNLLKVKRAPQALELALFEELVNVSLNKGIALKQKAQVLNILRENMANTRFFLYKRRKKNKF